MLLVTIIILCTGIHVVPCSAHQPNLPGCQPDFNGGISWTAALVGTTQTADCPDGNGKI